MSEQTNMASRYEREIPEGYEARIEGNKVIIELKESEDERIRKEIIDWMKGGTTYDWQENKEKWIAYLERQKEQKLSTPKYRVGEVMRTKQEAAEGVTDGLPVIVSVDDNYYYCTNEKIPISEQDEYEFPPMNMRQHPGKWSEDDERKITYLDDLVGYQSCMSKDKKKEFHDWFKSLRPQQKQEWSERDKDMLNSIIATCQLAAQDSDSGPARHLLELQERFLNSLPERFNLQPKQEWSEEDEKMLNGIIERGNSEIPNGECGLTPNQVAWLETRLKSLRPQPHWKPSVEQMADLDFSARLIGATCHNLKSLYYDLKEQYSL